MWIRKLFKLFTKAQKPDAVAGAASVPAPITLSAKQALALSRLLLLLLEHLDTNDRQAQEIAFTKMYLSGENFFTSILSSEAEGRPSTYLYTDIKGAEEAVESCQIIARDRGIKGEFSPSIESGAVDDVIDAFDIWLQASGHRFLQDADVDWGYAGVVVRNENATEVLEVATEVGLRFELGRKW